MRNMMTKKDYAEYARLIERKPVPTLAELEISIAAQIARLDREIEAEEAYELQCKINKSTS